MSGDRGAARSAAVLASALVVPALAGLVTVLLGDQVVRWEEPEAIIVARLALMLRINAVLGLICHVVAVVAAWQLMRRPPFSASTIAQPVVMLAALRPLGAVLVIAGTLVPSMRQPLVGFALAMVDAAFVAALLVVVAVQLAPDRARAVRWIGVLYGLIRVGSAAVALSSSSIEASAAFVHRVLTVLVVSAVAGALVALARSLGTEE